jgi:tRNA threonylcarbamoyladenosine biosynthesis protein TsaE
MLVSESAEQTIRLGSKIGGRLSRGDVVALHGPLGAGKTTLVKGIALSLHVEQTVTSQSFTLIAEYEGSLDNRPLILYHIDLYRIYHPQEIEELGIEEILNGEGISVIEWAEKAAEFLPRSTIHVEIAIEEAGKRRIRIQGI